MPDWKREVTERLARVRIVAEREAQIAHEFGTRLALGAQLVSILRMVIGQGARLALIGVSVGLCGSLWLTRFLETLLFNVEPTDPFILTGVVLMLTLVAALACYLPARRAPRVDPMSVSKCD